MLLTLFTPKEIPMKSVLSSTLALCLLQALLIVPSYGADASGAENPAFQAGLLAVTDLAQLNGQALACQEMEAVSRAKTLMLAHAPKTARFGNAFEETTHSSYLAQTRSNESTCPDANTLSSRLDVLAKRLQDTLPAAPAPAAGAQ